MTMSTLRLPAPPAAAPALAPSPPLFRKSGFVLVSRRPVLISPLASSTRRPPEASFAADLPLAAASPLPPRSRDARSSCLRLLSSL
jgi:hypothetical protein